jgi:hypothetical protein
MLPPAPVKRDRNMAAAWGLKVRISSNTNVMPRYFFHVREGSLLSRDEEGQELPNAEAARREAVSATREMLGENLLHGGSLNHRSVEIADAIGRIVDVVNSREVLFQDGRLRVYSDDVTQSAPMNTPRK